MNQPALTPAALLAALKSRPAPIPIGPHLAYFPFSDQVQVTRPNGGVTARPATTDDRQAADQMKWFHSPAADALRSNGWGGFDALQWFRDLDAAALRNGGWGRFHAPRVWRASSTSGRYWLAYALTDWQGEPSRGPSVVPRDADPAAFFAAINARP